ncbi:hypothetical protein L596_008836 [Steinernema carpocapsae]|uniref:Tyrosine-protein phosphatase domain-containing protein n=1 Tax=Steinernema carpocapsae TaxID=34508 RepID=A0A4U5PEG8_STECR|nr:hypothetical protein L596_008836 [Steinernema carpocapsae]
MQHNSSKSTSQKVLLSPKHAAAERFMDSVADVGMRGIRKEFILQVRGYVSNKSAATWKEEVSKDKNRYEDVPLLDETRVKLKNNAGDDYIHASYVKVHDELTYICAQGPIQSTIPHFLMMCVQEKTKVILQLCNFHEDGSEKCAEYLPSESDGTDWKTFGAVEIRATDRQTNVPAMKKVVKTKLQIKYKDETHELSHILYGGWPDHCPPESVSTCREIRALIHKVYDKKPIIAHCSAGIGRTGTFVAIEMALHRILTLADASFTIPEIVKELREQRMKAIQNDQQYVFVYRSTIDILLHEDILEKSDKVVAFITDYDELVARKKAVRAEAKATTHKGKTG